MKLFDYIAPIYDASLRLRQASKDEIVALLDVIPDAMVVDIGGGTGIGAHSAVRATGCRALVVDRSSGMLRKTSPDGSVSLLLADAAALPLTDASVDGALCLDALHHFQDGTAALREIRRVLRPGARLVVEDMDRRHAFCKVIALIERVFGEPCAFRTPAEMRSLFLTAGFSPMSITTKGGVYYAVASRQD